MKIVSFVGIITDKRADSSVGRAESLYLSGRGFESLSAHNINNKAAPTPSTANPAFIQVNHSAGPDWGSSCGRSTGGCSATRG